MLNIHMLEKIKFNLSHGISHDFLLQKSSANKTGIKASLFLHLYIFQVSKLQQKRKVS